MTQGPGYPRITPVEAEDEALVVPLTEDIATQSWFRFLQLIENPVQLTDATKIARKPKFIQMAKLNPNKDDFTTGSYHPCLANLPLIFLRTMEGISQMVDGFLGIRSHPQLRLPRRRSDYSTSASSTAPSVPSSSPPMRPKRPKELSRRPSKLNLPDVPTSEVSGSMTQIPSIDSDFPRSAASSGGTRKGKNSSSQNLIEQTPIYEDSVKR